jgi:hypothetical protein
MGIPAINKKPTAGGKKTVYEEVLTNKLFHSVLESIASGKWDLALLQSFKTRSVKAKSKRNLYELDTKGPYWNTLIEIWESTGLHAHLLKDQYEKQILGEKGNKSNYITIEQCFSCPANT